MTLIRGDCRPVMAGMGDSTVDAVVTDPPYGLEFMGKDWDRLGGRDEWRSGAGFNKPGLGDRPSRWPSFGSRDAANATCAGCGGRMRATRRCTCAEPDWRVKGEVVADRPDDHGVTMQRWHMTWAAEAYRVLKPGGYLLAFGGPRTAHRLVCALEDTGFEIRDSIIWLFGSGFPKSLNVGKAIDNAANEGGPLEVEWDGWGTALEPGHEPICLAQKRLVGGVVSNVRVHGTGALNIDGCRIDGVKDVPTTPRRACQGPTYGDPGEGTGWDPHVGRWPANVVLSHAEGCELLGQRSVGSGDRHPAQPGSIQPFSAGNGWHQHSMTRDGGQTSTGTGRRRSPSTAASLAARWPPSTRCPAS